MHRRGNDPYAGADIDNARRFAGTLWGIGLATVLGLVPFYPPTEAIGQAGWAVVGAVVVATSAGLVLFVRRPQLLTFPILHLTGYTSLGCLAALEWLSGGAAPYDEVFLLPVLGMALVHPFVRTIAFLGVMAVVVSLPLLYGSVSAGELAAKVAVWSGIALVFVTVMARVRAQRAGLREDGELARHLARVDPLTGLGNRRAFDEAVTAAVAAARATGHPLSLLALDVDDLKPINDRFGHPAGDDCLRAVADALRSDARRPDACFRWGGDEFAVLLPETDALGADGACARLRTAVQRRCIRPDGAPVQVGIGYAELEPDADGDALVAAADRALLEAKAARPVRDRASRAPA